MTLMPKKSCDLFWFFFFSGLFMLAKIWHPASLVGFHWDQRCIIVQCVTEGRDNMGETNLGSKFSREELTSVVFSAKAVSAWGSLVKDQKKTRLFSPNWTFKALRLYWHRFGMRCDWTSKLGYYEIEGSLFIGILRSGHAEMRFTFI